MPDFYMFATATRSFKQSGLENCWPLSAIVTKAISAIAKIV